MSGFFSPLFGGNKNKNVENVAPVVGNLRLSTSALGAPIPIVLGKNRVKWNLLWYGALTAIPTTVTTTSGGGGGKGGSSGDQTVSTTTYAYTAAVAAALAEGLIHSLGTIWSGKNRLTQAQLGLSLATGSFAQTAWGYLTTNFAGQDLAYRGISYVYTSALALGDTPDMPNLTFEVSGDSALGLLGSTKTFTAAAGTPTVFTSAAHGLALNDTVRLTNSGGALPGGLVAGQDYYLVAVAANTFELSLVPDNATVLPGGQPITCTSLGTGTQRAQKYVPDALVSSCVSQLLANQYYGSGFPSAALGSLTSMATYCQAAGIVISPAWMGQETAASILERLLKIAYTGLVFSEGVAKFIPYYDQALTANGVTFTPDLTVRYAFGDEHFLRAADADPVTVSRSDPADTFTQFQVQYQDRMYDYNSQTAQIIDQAGADQYGLRPASVETFNEIVSADVAQWVVGLAIQRAQNVRNAYAFKLPQWTLLLEPMDFVSLTDTNSDNGLSGVVVRMTEMEEDENGEFTCVAEDAPAGAASTQVYPTQPAGGYVNNYNATAGDVAAPAFFTPQQSNSVTGLSVGIAVTGTADNYGGCEVWVSADGTTYSLLGVQNGGGSIYGITSSTVTAADGQVLGVSLSGLGGTMIGAAAADALNNATLSLVDKEFFDYTTATLTGANAYDLTMTYRGVVDLPSSVPVAHGIGEPFLRLDRTIVYGNNLPLAQANQPLFFKFLSFNIYNGGKQSLADVSPYSYTVGGFPDADFATYLSHQDQQGITSTSNSVATGLRGNGFNYTFPCYAPSTGLVYQLGRIANAGNTVAVVTDPVSQKILTTQDLGIGAITLIPNPFMAYSPLSRKLYFTVTQSGIKNLYSLDPSTLAVTAYALPSARSYFVMCYSPLDDYVILSDGTHTCFFDVSSGLFSGESSPMGANTARAFSCVYVPSADKIAFTASGGGTYYVGFLSRDTTSASFLNVYGSTAAVPSYMDYSTVDDRLWVAASGPGGTGFHIVTPSLTIDSFLADASATQPVACTYIPESRLIYSVENSVLVYTYDPRTRTRVTNGVLSLGTGSAFSFIRCPPQRRLVTFSWPVSPAQPDFTQIGMNY